MTDTGQNDGGDWRRLIRDVPDFPKPGIVFKDITPLLADASGFAAAVAAMVEPVRSAGLRVDAVCGAESRGFIFGVPVAQALGVGFVPIRKPGKLPRAVRSASYELEYGSDTVEVHADALAAGSRVLLVDDLLATGGTAGACCRLIEESDATVAALSVLIELAFLPGRAALPAGVPVHAAVTVAG